jgi:predicted Zn-dependent peptidase
VAQKKNSSGLKIALLISTPIFLFGAAGAGYWQFIRGGEYDPLRPRVVEQKSTVALVPADQLSPLSSATDYSFGGRSLPWWSKRLTDLKARSDARGLSLFALTKERAEANGLVVDEGAQIKVHISPELMENIGRRLEKKAEVELAPLVPMRPGPILSSRASKKHPRLILAPREGPRATIHIRFRAGAFDDGHQSGLTKLAQHAMLRANGAADAERFFLELFAANGTLEIETGVRESGFMLTAPSQELVPLAKQLASMVLAPKITSAGFETAKSHALQAEADASIEVLFSAIARTVFSEPGYQNNPEGDKDTIRTLSVSDVSRHITKSMSPANAVIVVAGNIDAKKMRAILGKFSGGTARTAERPKGELAGNYHQRSPMEAHLVAFPVALKTARSAAAARFAGVILQDKIFQEFRKRGLVYSVAATAVRRDWLDSVVIMLPLDRESPPPVGTELNIQLEALKQGGVDDASFERNRRYLLEDFRALDEDPERLAAELVAGDAEWYGPKVAKAIEEMSKAEMVQELGDQLSTKASIHVHFSPKTGAAAEKSANR